MTARKPEDKTSSRTFSKRFAVAISVITTAVACYAMHLAPANAHIVFGVLVFALAGNYSMYVGVGHKDYTAMIAAGFFDHLKKGPTNV